MSTIDRIFCDTELDSYFPFIVVELCPDVVVTTLLCSGTLVLTKLQRAIVLNLKSGGCLEKILLS